LSGGCTVNLPTLSYGTSVAVKNLSTGPETVTVKTTDSSTIDGIAGSTGFALAAEYDTVVLTTDGVNWYSLSGGPIVASS
jgi:hypothetical protein